MLADACRCHIISLLHRMSNYLALRSSAAPTFTVSTLLAKSISFQSTTISLGQSTNQSYNNFSNGSFTTGWASTLTGLTSIKKVVLSPNGSAQTVLQNSGSTMSTVITSLNSGSTWTGSTMRGLPTSGALPYQTYGSTINAMPVPSITAITAAPSGTNQLAIASNDLVYASNNSGATFAATGLGQNNSPFIYMPFDGSVADVMGNATVTTTGSMAYVPGKVGTQALNLQHTAGGTASNYIDLITAPLSSFTASGWFNMQTFSATQSQYIFSGNGSALSFSVSTTGVCRFASLGVSITTSFTISTNIWYQFTVVFQSAGLCSLYINGSLIGQATGTAVVTAANMRLGAISDYTIYGAFSGYIDDFRLYNYAVTNPSGAALINPIVGPIMPYVYLTFDGSTTTDVMGNSTVTATGSPGFVAGQVGSNALSMASNAGTGSNPTQYVTGTISGLGNAITFSVWFQALILPTSNQATVWSMNAVTSGGAIVQFTITTAGLIIFQYYNGSAWQQVSSASAISLNTWYNAVCIYQAGTTCSLYINGALTTMTGSGSITPAIASYTLGGGQGTPATPNFGFKGYIDDFRIYNGAFTPSQLSPVLYSPSYAIGSPNIYLPFENGSVLDVMGYSAVSARGTMNFVPGVVGSAALNLVNPMTGTAVNYLRGSWAGSPNFTVSFWFNAQALGGQQTLFSAYVGNYVIYLNSSNQIVIYLPSGGAALNALPGPVISINTWYYVTAIFQTNGVCTLYINNSLIGSYTNSGGVGSYTTTAFGIGTYDNTTILPFNGYIDDFKLYNSAVPFSALGPMNYTQAAISNSGAYQVVAPANGGVYTSANSGSTWSQATTSPQPAAAVNTVGGQLITPQLTGLAATTWTQNGVNWVASASATFSASFPSYNAFNNNTTANNIWAPSSTTYSTTGNSSGITTAILGVGNATGDWVQIQSSVPLVMSSYQFASGGNTIQLPKTYYIVGSNDGSTWYPIQYGSGGAVTSTAQYTLVPGVIIVNSASTQTFGSSTITTTTYSTTTNAYTYFRLIGMTIYYVGVGAAVLEIAEWYINFATPATPLYVAPSTALIANQSLNAITVTPQQTGLASNTWTTNGVTWTASASSIYDSDHTASKAFNNNISGAAVNRWATPSGTYTSSTGAYLGSVSTTIQGGIGAILGEWIQLSSSVPLILSSYTGSCGFDGKQFPKIYYLIGSNDGTTWFPIQSANITTTPFTTAYSACSNYLQVNFTGTQTLIAGQAGSVTTTSYSTSTQAYIYFRMVITHISVVGATAEINELYYNFTAYTPALLQSLSMSPSGQYMALTGAGATTPNLTGLTGATGSSGIVNSWTTNGVTWISSASNNTNAASPWHLFNNASLQSWVPTSMTYSTTGNTSGTSNTFFTNGASTLTVQGDWAQLQSSIPLVMASYAFGCGYASARLPKTYYIIGSNDGVTWYAIQSGIGAAAPTVAANYSLIGSTLIVNSNSVQPFGTSTITTTTYSAVTLPFLYFRLVNTSSYNVPASADFLEIGEWYINFQSGPTFYSTDYGSSWTRSLTAATVPNANVLATSGNGQYSLQACGQTVIIANNTSGGNPTSSYTTPTFSPALSSATGAVSNAAVSASGQYIVVLIQGTSNNVYYSSNYGVSFTGITLGSTAMVSCAVSADGSYITVASATQVFTLNSNTQGLSITVGNQSGLINQGQNAIAIGNQAGQINQSANSIILNSSGTAVNAYAPGFFVAPVASSGSSVSSSFAVLGYGTDNQVVQTGLTVLTNGFVGIGISPVNTQLQFASTITNRKIVLWDDTLNSDHQYYGFGVNPNILRYQVPATSANHVFYAGTSATTSNELMRVTGGGLVGIGITAPVATLDVAGTIRTTTGIQITGANVIDFGYNVTKDAAAGKIGYQTFAPFTSLDIVGAGTNNTTRSIKLYDNVIVQGSISKASGTFDIGHPLYPDTPKRLVHSFIEGPRCDLIYRGKTTLIDGSALVNIDKECTHSPECAMDEGTFEVLCDNPQIFLQNNQSFDRVRGVISGAILTITCENPASVEIEWMVIAERADPFIKKWERTNPDGYLITQYTAENNTIEMPSE